MHNNKNKSPAIPSVVMKQIAKRYTLAFALKKGGTPFPKG